MTIILLTAGKLYYTGTIKHFLLYEKLNIPVDECRLWTEPPDKNLESGWNGQTNYEYKNSGAVEERVFSQDGLQVGRDDVSTS